MDFEKLAIYQKALDFVDRVYETTKPFPQAELFGLTSQFRRAATSIVLNIAEGAGRDTKADRRRFYTIARGSVFECIALIEICRRRNFIDDKRAQSLKDDCEELSRMLHGLKSSLDHLK